MKIEGGCFCGAVRFAAAARPFNSMVCHCQTCRRVSGSPAVAWLTFHRKDFRFIKGTPAEFASSPAVLRRFCSACGTPLTYESRQSAGEVDVTTVSLDEPNAFPPTHHSWISHDLDWVKFGDGLPQFEKSRY